MGLGLKPTSKELLNVSTFGTNKSSRSEFDVVSLILSKGAKKFEVSALVSSIISPSLSVGLRCDWMKYPELKELPLADDISDRNQLDIDILIGSDTYGLFVTGKIIKCQDGPMATKSRFGWFLSGPIGLTGRRDSRTLCHRIEVYSDQELDEVLPTFWEINTLEKCVAAEF